ncbi:MAG: TetR/AcrR family transcriptional regulator [Pseudomonadota bacterium]
MKRTRQRILDQAGALFRRFGYRGVGIDKIMNAAGLTRGGFYAHFKSKSDLFVTVIAEDFNFTKQIVRLQKEPDGAPRNRALFAIRQYLNTATRDHIGGACTMAASAVDVAAADHEAKAAFEARLDDLLSGIGDLFREDGVALNRAELHAILATSVGGLVLARACNDRAAEDMLQASYALIERVVDG